MARRGEFQLIADLFAPLAAGEAGALGLTDDAAVLDLAAGRKLVVTADAIVEGVHFLPDDPPDLIARKLVRVNLSDLAAMGAVPRALILTCAWPAHRDDAWIERFVGGLRDDVQAFAVPVVGGDTVSTPGPATFTVTALGTVPAESGGLTRRAAAAGCKLAVTGTIGDAALGLLVAQGEVEVATDADRDALVDRYRLPRPRVGVGPRLLGLADACIDISDGLIQDLGHICAASGVGGEIEQHRVPLSDAARRLVEVRPDLWQTVLSGGDDYELLCAYREEREDAVLAAAAAEGVPLTPIGRLRRGEGVRVLGYDGHPLQIAKGGFSHF